MSGALSMLIALGLDAAIGWPDGLYRRIGHPVTWLGHLIAALDRRLNRETATGPARFRAGLATTLIVIALATGAALALCRVLPGGWAGTVLAGVLAWPLVAARSMYAHVSAVSRPLRVGDLSGARRAVSMIVGRDPQCLDAAGVARAALESLAENTSDGIVAPLFWGAFLGLPGIAAYKAINTLDSMIGHRTTHHEQFGKAAARIDDIANLIPARLTGLMFALLCAQPLAALHCMARDAGHHRSPNAGWPEAALAGALQLRLSGPRAYGDRISQEPWINGAAPDPRPDDLGRGLGLYLRTMVALACCLGLLALL
ncbi:MULTISPECIES: adenosylcobinamide-phosphate synthase CbiB [Actibacterium]|uniref:Cobalamin biosynthesis protein CobD n=1 Tax=Actibacterium naphthalenivorans TaxID=1614693 RepID=A0A840CFL2_9RHOB|nr:MULTISPECIES: adenosylcobinamide-phosphate synthase CbiB [Actibacterium]ALG91465.1 cobalamin biosynthesis protein CobD [Actibacterium sp. EMB200-NS6]MBB4022902.1 adenosylcobinamide-phosphate synthase [Actibacterium naphthalenivorans]